MKRFYRDVNVVDGESAGWCVHLDGKPIRTPGRTVLCLPTRGLADAVAAEWSAQVDTVRPASMPLTQLSNVALDQCRVRREEIVAAVAAYGETDLLCYRADGPDELSLRQARLWQPLLDWAVETFDAPLIVTAGILHQPQPAGSVQALTRAVGELDDWQLAAVQDAVGPAGSLILALALVRGRVTGDELFTLSQLDESFQIERWGEDAEAAQRRSRLKSDMAATARFVALLARDGQS
jgi:chaperone required for assembly of F1-ATPase